MTRIKFTLDAWLKDKSQRVETRDGRIVHNIWPVKEPVFFHGKRTDVCALIDGEEDMILFFEGGQYLPINSENPFDLFIVTPEEELSKFEKAVYDCAWGKVTCKTEGESKEEYAKRHAATLLSLAIDARARELSKGLNQSKLDKDSIPYHLIEFMCNLYDCQNWKEIEEIAELYVTRIKAAALKDLPRWRVELGDMEYVAYGIIGGGIASEENPRVYLNGRSIDLYSLRKLPGFKEEEI